MPAPSTPATSQIAVLHSRTSGLEAAVNKLEGEFVRLESAVTAGFANISEKMAQRDKTPWPVIWSGLGLLVAVLAAIGGLAYAPVLSKQTELSGAIKDIQDQKATREHVLAIQRLHEREMNRMERQFEKLEAEIFWRRNYRPPAKNNGGDDK